MVQRLAFALWTLAALSPVRAQNLDHPGQVHLGEGRWGTPDEARAEGLVTGALAAEEPRKQKPPAPREWVMLAAPKPRAGTSATPSEDVRDYDFVWSVGGAEIHSLQAFADRLAARAKDAPLELVLVRFEPSYQDPFATTRFVRTELASASAARLQPIGSVQRHRGLRD